MGVRQHLVRRLDERPTVDISSAVLNQFLKSAPRDFQMKLQSEHPSIEFERLIAARIALGKAHRALWQIKSFTVPMQHRDARRHPAQQFAFTRFGSRPDGKPTNFLVAILIHARSQDTGNELCAEAYAQNRLLRAKSLFDQFLLGPKPG